MTTTPTHDRLFEPHAIAVLGLAILAAGLVLAYLLYEIWPAVVHATAKTPTRQRITLFDGHIKFRPSAESVLILLVILAGALGAYIHAATAFAKYVGTRRFERSWYWWYLGRLPIGSALALVVYFALRGGLVGGDATSNASDRSTLAERICGELICETRNCLAST
jgi:hypothetical protein